MCIKDVLALKLFMNIFCILYAMIICQHSFFYHNQALPIYTDSHKGVMTPPVLVDITGDGVVDIVFSAYNATVLAIDGQTFVTLWNTTFGGSETYAYVL